MNKLKPFNFIIMIQFDKNKEFERFEYTFDTYVEMNQRLYSEIENCMCYHHSYFGVAYKIINGKNYVLKDFGKYYVS